jgi:hypothetical protein
MTESATHGIVQVWHRIRSHTTRLALVGALAVTGLIGSASTAAAADGDFTGSLVVSTTTTTVGTPFTVTENAINLGSTQIPSITVGINRVCCKVVSVVRPRTGLCRIAGSATCSFLLLAPHETQFYTLTLTAYAPGTYVIKGWTTQPSTGRGFGASATITVK